MPTFPPPTAEELADARARLAAIDAILAGCPQDATQTAHQAICKHFGVKYTRPLDWRNGEASAAVLRWGVRYGYIDPYVEGPRRHGDTPTRYIR